MTARYPLVIDANGRMAELPSGDTLAGAGGSPGGTTGQVQYNNAGAFDGFTLGGDATLNTATGTVTIASNAVTTAKINNAAVTLAKIANAAANSRVVGSGSAGSGAAYTELTTTQVLDAIATTQGAVLYRGASSWSALAPGTSGYVLQANGAAANPSWVPTGGGGAGGTDYFCDPSITKTVPVVGAMSTDHGTAASVSLAASGSDRALFTVTSTGAGFQSGFAYVAHPGVDCTLVVQFLPQIHVWNNNTQHYGLGVRNGTGAVYLPGITDFNNSFNGGASSQLDVRTFGSLSSSISGTGYSWWQGYAFSGAPMWMKFQQSSGNYIMSISQDGVTWKALDSRATSILTTPTQIGFLYINTASGQPTFATSLFSWKLTTP